MLDDLIITYLTKSRQVLKYASNFANVNNNGNANNNGAGNANYYVRPRFQYDLLKNKSLCERKTCLSLIGK